MPSLSRFMNGFLNRGDVELGRLILDTQNPQKNFCKAASLTLTDGGRSRREFQDVDSLTNATSASSFRLLLTKVLEVFANKSGKSIDTIRTTKAVSYELYNVDEKLETLLEDDMVKRWLEKYKSKTRIYIVVALHTVQDVAVTLDHNQSSEVRAKVTIPAAEVSDAVTPGASMLDKVADPQVEVSHSHTRDQSASFVAPGERIIAVGYQEVCFRSFHSSMADAPTLAKKTVWKSFDTSRATGAADMLEATVEDVSEFGKGIQVLAESVGPSGRFAILKDRSGH